MEGENMREMPSLFCDHKPHHMEAFPGGFLLLLLYDEVGYGYGLVEQLSHFGFSEPDLNVSTLYRTLRKMEHDGLVTSLWESGGQGPRRRVYEITDDGRSELDQWIKVLKVRKARIETLVGAYDRKVSTEDK